MQEPTEDKFIDIFLYDINNKIKLWIHCFFL